MKSTSIAFIINSFNRLNLLKEALIVLSKWMPYGEFAEKCEIVIFDAGSTDGTIEWLESEAIELGLHIHVLKPKTGDDTSFAAGLNKGVQEARNLFPNLKYLVFYETDNQIKGPAALRNAIIQLENKPKLGACGFTVLRHNGTSAGVGMPFLKTHNFLLGKNIVSKFKLESIHYKWETDASGVPFSYVDVVFTSPLVVKLEAWIQSGGLDAEMFPFSACDVDWAKRLGDLGWKMGVIKTDEAIHDNLAEISNWSKRRAMSSHQGRLRYVKRHHPFKFYLVWPVPLLVRHAFELLAAKTFIKDPVRKKQLTEQYSGLLKACLKQYKSSH